MSRDVSLDVLMAASDLCNASGSNLRFRDLAPMFQEYWIAIAIEARRAATGNTDAVHESAGPKDIELSRPASDLDPHERLEQLEAQEWLSGRRMVEKVGNWQRITHQRIIARKLAKVSA